jgi:hypothetical protein
VVCPASDASGSAAQANAIASLTPSADRLDALDFKASRAVC